MNNQAYQVVARTEVWQLILTVVIFMTYASMLFGLQYLLASSIGENADLSAYVTNKLLFFEKELKDSIAGASTLQYQYIVKGSVRVPFLAPVLHQSLRPEKLYVATAAEAIVCLPFTITLISPQCLPMAILNYLAGALFQIANLSMATQYQYTTYSFFMDMVISQYASFAETLAIPLRIGFSFLFSDLIAVLPLMAVVLRLLPFTRQAGNMLFTLSFAFGAVFPFMLAVFYQAFENFYPVNQFCTETLSTGSTVSEVFTFGPFSTCDAEFGFPKLVSYYPLFIVVPYLSLAIALTFATNFNKLFDYFKR